MLIFDKTYYIMVGNYGSGKTELSLNLAARLRETRNGRVALVDLDIVNPYFRSAEKRDMLEGMGIEVFAPTFAMSTVDIPALPAEISGVFAGGYAAVVIDVGGDDTGAAALGVYAPDIARLRGDMAVCYVVNPFRPLSSTASDVIDMASLIESRSRLKPDIIVNNANLQSRTSAEDLIEAQPMIDEIAAALGARAGMVCGEERLLEQLPARMRDMFFPVTPFMRPEWLEDTP